MKLKFSSLKFQILAAFTLMAVPLFIFADLMLSAHNTFTGTLNSSFDQEQVRDLTAKVQRDVMDLQRNVLRYKNIASENSVNNIQALYENLTRNIARLKTGNANLPKNAVESIERHLNEYKNNFDIVVSYRRLRKDLVESHQKFLIEGLTARLNQMNEVDQLKLQENLRQAHNHSLGYLIDSDAEHINELKNALRIARGQISENESDESKALKKIIAYEMNFMKIVNLTRNYVYLINVVMAGSAQEILYYADFLAQYSRDEATKVQAQAYKQLDQLRTMLAAVSALALLVAILVPTYFFRLITRPIESITHVFKALSEGKVVADIPGQGRDDEIGYLANAASVFKEKNEQTIQLLDEAKKNVYVQRTLNQELRDAKRKAEKALSVKTDFLANMSHELRTPLNSVIGYTVRLLKKPDNFSERQLGALHTIERNGRHLLAMINDVLDLSKIDADKLDINFEYLELVELCEDVIHQLAGVAEEKGLTLSLDTAGQKIITVETDQVRLTQILINLLSNGIKYTESGWVALSVVPANDLTSVTINISDSGAGIRKGDMDRLFKRFEQFDEQSRYKVGHGTGLGLAIVAKLSRLLGAKIKVESEFGKGSTFSVTIPRKRSRSLAQTSSAA